MSSTKPIQRRGVGSSMPHGKQKVNSVVEKTLTSRPGTEKVVVKDFQEILLSKVVFRDINQYSQKSIDKLAFSIKEVGLLNPIVVGRISDLSKDSERYKGLLNKYGEETLKEKEFFICAGERRYRSFEMLYNEEEKLIADQPSKLNKYETITAQVIPAEELGNEERIYEESNTLARQLNTNEKYRLCVAALNRINSEDEKNKKSIAEKKRDIMLEMDEAGYGFDKAIPDDPIKAADFFNEAKYCAYYIANQLGIEEFNFNTAKTYTRVYNAACKEVTDAICDEKINLEDAKKITKFKEDSEQKLLLDYLLNGERGRFDEVIAKGFERKNTKRYSNKSARKVLNNMIATINEEKKKVEDQHENLGKAERKIMEEALKAYDDFSAKLSLISEKLQ